MIITRKLGIRSRLKKLFRYPEIGRGRERLRAFARGYRSECLPLRSVDDAGTLAIVVPCYRHDRYLERMAASILNQTRKPNQVVFVDDCSPDATRELLPELAVKLERAGGITCRIFTNERNMGQSASINRAISAVNTSLVMVLNDDDYLMHDAVEMVMTLFERNPDLYLIGSRNIEFGSDDELSRGAKLIRELSQQGSVPLTRHLPEDVAGYSGYNDLNMTHSGSCFLKAAWQVVGGYHADRRARVVPFSDRDFQLRVNALFPVAVSNEVPFVYWRNNSSVDNGINS